MHFVKKVRIWSYSGPHFRIEYREIRSISPNSVRMRENADQSNPKYGHFSHSDSFHIDANRMKGQIE